jgi:triosephosphate isomerase
MARVFIAGNWKMNGLRADIAEAEALKASFSGNGRVEAVVCPPPTLLMAFADRLRGSGIALGGQDCHVQEKGAFTGDVSAAMLKDAGADWVILGHSERRNGHGETSMETRAKAQAALRGGLHVILCVGETLGEREAGLAEAVCLRQLRDSLPQEATAENTVMAYEPVWAIGTGRVASPSEYEGIHAALRSSLPGRGWRIVYGGSVTPANAPALLASPHVDGLLVGSASLKASSFLSILAAADHAAQQKGAGG